MNIIQVSSVSFTNLIILQWRNWIKTSKGAFERFLCTYIAVMIDKIISFQLLLI